MTERDEFIESIELRVDGVLVHTESNRFLEPSPDILEGENVDVVGS